MIHKFKALGVNVVIDVPSGAIHILDDVAFKLIDCFEEGEFDFKKAAQAGYSKDEIEESYKELGQLIDQGMLFTKDEFEEIAKNWNKQSAIKALCLHICHDCNLRCKYCFADTGSFHGKRSFMSADVGKKAIDFVIKSSKNRRNIEIDYFGGEPLMNFEVVREITEYAKQQAKIYGKEFRFTITTNGLLLDEDTKAYINENMSNVVLSIDGRKETNDYYRKRADGSGTYDRIVPKFLDMAKSRGQKNYYVRGTFTSHNLDFVNDVLHLADIGFKQISIEPVVAPYDTDYALREEHLEKIFEQYEKLALEMVKREKRGEGFNFFHFMMDFDEGPCAYKRLSGCGAGHEYVAVTPEGDIYPCHQFVGNEKFKMGNVSDGKISEEIKDAFEKSNIYTKRECRNCWARFYCSGGCSANAYNFNGDINKPYKLSCEMEKKRVECAIAMAALLSE